MDNTITIADAARDNYQRARQAIESARAAIGDIPITNDWQTDRDFMDARADKVREMERSLYDGFMHLIMVTQDHDGPLRIMADGKMGFFWSHEKSGYHGGLIFHVSYEDGEPTVFGRWSIHT